MNKYLIIGTGVSGIAAAEAIRTIDAYGSILLVGNEPDIYYSRPGLAFLLTGEIPEERLYPFTPEDFKRLRVELSKGRATRIERSSKRVCLADGRNISYDRLLIATGAAARRAQVPGADLPGVVKLDNIADARRIIQRARKTRQAVVVGGGITALELVEGLCANRVRVHYFLRGDRYWGNVLDETESRIIEHRLKEDGVVIHYHTELAEILGKKGGMLQRGPERVSAVITKEGQEIPCDLVAVAIGVVPRIKLFQEAGLPTERGVLVNEYLKTGDPFIYAAGDVAQVYDPLSGRSVVDSLWGPARDQGWVAGLNMAGVPTQYQKKPPVNVTRLAGLTTTIIGAVGAGGQDDDLLGIVRGDSETWRENPDAIAVQSNFDVNRIRLMIGSRTLLGAILIGDQKLSQPIHELVINQVDITPIRDSLLQANGQIAEILLNFWTELRTEQAVK